MDKGPEYITVIKANYVANGYHAPFDEWQPDWDWTGAVWDVKLMCATGRAIANSTDWPEC